MKKLIWALVILVVVEFAVFYDWVPEGHVTVESAGPYPK